MPDQACNNASLCMLLEVLQFMYRVETTVLVEKYVCAKTARSRRRILDRARRYSVIKKILEQVKYLDKLVHVTDADCVANLRMDRNTFAKLCRILHARGGLRIGKTLGVEEQVAMFLGVLAHHNKNRVVKFHFARSGATVSQCVHKVLAAVLSLHSVLLSKPTPAPADCTDHRWKWFTGCLGALDDTHINVLVSNEDKPRYRTRKGQIRAFAVLKMRWGILRSASFYPIQTQIRLIMSCFLLHNFIRQEMDVDPVEVELDYDEPAILPEEDNIGVDYVGSVEPSAQWTQLRDAHALNMWNNS
ncbi:uncharacterized protein LOC121757827 [Salvia splendens]|uniref:uncharacterized protein LOC121757827 n=1 Tax=Salvia splendens TaxID=180675 RepID=UPI001C254A77|nr:uncharacterized protein LOC121757827 [Salvia splendens]